MKIVIKRQMIEARTQKTEERGKETGVMRE